MEKMLKEIVMKLRAIILLVLALFVVAGCGYSGPPLEFEEFAIGMSISDVDAELKSDKWLRVGTTTYASVVRYELQVREPKPLHLDDISRVELTTVDGTLVAIEVVTFAETFSTLKETMKSLDEVLALQYGEPRRETAIDELQPSQISGREPVTLSVWRVDPPRRFVAMAVHEEGGQPIGLINYVYMDKNLQKKTR
jgi:hypothetical protein